MRSRAASAISAATVATLPVSFWPAVSTTWICSSPRPGKRAASCRRAVGYRLLGTLDSPVSNYVTITSAYTARFGVPAVGSRVFVSVNSNVNGYEGVPLVFSARVPAAA